MTRPEYGKPETWPHRILQPQRMVHFDVEFRRLFWYVTKQVWDLPLTHGAVIHPSAATVAGPYWHFDSAMKRAVQLLDAEESE